MQTSRRPCFFHCFNPASSSKQLKVPSEFIKHIEGQTSEIVTLVGPSGHSWLVDLIHQNDSLFLQSGWAAFVQNHFLEQGDALVFRYDGNLHFTVQVFDQSSCEKQAAFSVECTQDTAHVEKLMTRKRERQRTHAPVEDIFEGVPKKLRESQVRSETWQLDELASATETNEVAAGSLEMGNCWRPSKSVISFAAPLQSVTENNIDTTSQNVGGKQSQQDYAMGMLSTSEAEELARSFNSCYPNFTKTMKAFNVKGSYTLNIPYQFSMAHLPNCKVKIVLRNLKGETWTVNSVPTTKVNMAHTLCGGWLAFVRDNYINVGDICVFELVSKCEFRVYILRVGREGLECPNTKPVVKGVPEGFAVNSHKISGGSRKKMKGNACKTKIDVSGKKGSHSKAFDGKPVMWNNIDLEERQGSYTKGCMSLKSVPEEKFAAQFFVSTLPHFVRVMKKFNISGSYTLKVPYQFSKAHLPSCTTEIFLHNLKGEVWSVNSVPSTRVNPLHTFCGGWMTFVRDNNIQMGDICIFELIGKYKMRVHISGIGKNELDYLNTKGTSNRLHS